MSAQLSRYLLDKVFCVYLSGTLVNTLNRVNYLPPPRVYLTNLCPLQEDQGEEGTYAPEFVSCHLTERG